MPGKKKDPAKEYSPNWGGDRKSGSAPETVVKRITVDEWELLRQLREKKEAD